MPVAYNISHECPHCGNEIAVDTECPDEVTTITCRVCSRPSTFENGLYHRWLDHNIRTLQVGARASRFVHR